MEFRKQLELKRRAEAGDVEAMYDYGVFLYLETPDYESGLRYLMAAAAQDWELAFCEIGIILYNEKNDPVNAEKWFEKAETADCLLPWAAFDYGRLLYHDKRDPERALKYLYQAADENYEPAFGEIAVILYKEMEDAETAEKWFNKAEKAGCLFAPIAYEYGMMVYFEKDDWDKALKYLCQAADDEFELAYGEIGNILFFCKRDPETAQIWLEKAEKADCLFAPEAYAFGMLLLEKGEEDRALKYFLDAANDDYDSAYEEIGKIYEKRNDHENAEIWFNKARDVSF